MFSRAISEQAEMRLIEERHAEELFALINRNQEHIHLWSAWLTANHTLKDTKDFIKRSLVQFADNNGLQAGIWCDGEMVGQIGFSHIKWRDRTTEIGYWLAASYQGRGLITSR